MGLPRRRVASCRSGLVKLLQTKLGPQTTHDALGLLISYRIGQGQHRDVYASHVLPDHVVKIERGENRFCNPMEWIIWGQFKDTKWAKWLAPCHSISGCGLVLLQRRCDPLDERPRLVPSFLADLKRQNWGTIDGRPVCFDYGNNAVFELARKNTRLVRADWHNGIDGKTL